jgi:uncharacterized membrane protein YecN with MAPEG domain
LTPGPGGCSHGLGDQRLGEIIVLELHMPVVTTLAAGALGIIFTVLSVLVVLGRNSGKVLLGDGAETAQPLFIAIRSHGNFAEYVPLVLLLIGLLELRDGPTLAVKIMAGALVLARVLHPIGMRIPGANPFRALGFLLTVLTLAAASVAVLLSVA